MTENLSIDSRLEDFLFKEGVIEQFLDNVLTQKGDVDEHVTAIVGAFDWSKSKENYYFWDYINKKYRHYIKIKASLTFDLIETDRGIGLLSVAAIHFECDTPGIEMTAIKGIDFNSEFNKLLLELSHPDDN